MSSNNNPRGENLRWSYFLVQHHSGTSGKPCSVSWSIVCLSIVMYRLNQCSSNVDEPNLVGYIAYLLYNSYNLSVTFNYAKYYTGEPTQWEIKALGSTIPLDLKTCKIPLAPMGALAPGSAHARPSAQAPIYTSQKFSAQVSGGGN